MLCPVDLISFCSLQRSLQKCIFCNSPFFQFTLASYFLPPSLSLSFTHTHFRSNTITLLSLQLSFTLLSSPSLSLFHTRIGSNTIFLSKSDTRTTRSLIYSLTHSPSLFFRVQLHPQLKPFFLPYIFYQPLR